MALFGAPLAHEDHAVRACYAALRMQESVRRYADQVRRREGFTPQIRLGMHSGEVVVRSIGSDLRVDYSAIGQSTHLAARMEQLATPGTIVITADTLRLAEGYVQVTPLGPMRVKGLSDPVEAYEVTGVGPARTRIQAAAGRGLTRFVGRDGELEVLRRALAQAAEGQGQVVAVVGEAGVGKSRLAYEFTRSHRTHGWLVLESGSVSYGKATSYLPVIDLLRAYFGILARDDPRQVREKVVGKLLTLDEALRPALPALLALLDIQADDPAWRALDPPQRRQRTLDAVKRLLLRESRVQPTLVIFEDLHWIDAETQVLLDSLVDSLPSARLLLLVNYRPEYQHGWGNKSGYTQVRLDRLPETSAGELLRALFGPDRGLDALEALLIARTAGNPFFLEESVRTLVETGVLAGERGGYRLARAVREVEIPATVQAILAARIDRLPPGEKHLLQAASVVGHDVPFALLQCVSALSEDEVREKLARLQSAEFLFEARLFPDLEYTFKHALTHEVAYGTLLQERRRELHARIVEEIERLHPDRLSEHVERLGHHAFRGGSWETAARYLRQAGAKALERSANREAAGWFEQALVALGHLPETTARLAEMIDLRLELRGPLYALGELERLFDNLVAAEALAQRLGDQRRLGRVSCYLAEHFRLIGDRDRAVAAGQRGTAIADAVDDFPLRIMANFYLGLVFCSTGEYTGAVDCFTRNVTSLTPDLEHRRFGLAGPAAVLSRAWLVVCLAEIGEFQQGRARGEEAVEIAQSAGQPWSLAAAYFGIGGLYLTQGEVDRAVPLLEHGLAVSERGDVPMWFHMIAASLGRAYAQSGRIDDALRILEDAVAQAGAMRVTARYALALSWLSEAYLMAGRVEAAGALAARATELSREHNERGHEAWSLRLRGEIAAHPSVSAFPRAAASYREALALAEALGMRPLAAHCHLGLGKLYRRLGDEGQADAHLRTSASMFETLEMTSWLHNARMELARTG
jgi:tetratricopeptide (TPR) repeat protein